MYSLPRVILVENLCKPNEIKKEMIQIHQIRMGPSWMDSIVLFLKKDILSKGKSKVDKVQKKASQFWLSEDQKLYKRSFSGAYLLCILSEDQKLYHRIECSVTNFLATLMKRWYLNSNFWHYSCSQRLQKAAMGQGLTPIIWSTCGRWRWNKKRV